MRNNGERVEIQLMKFHLSKINQWIKEHQENKNTDAQDKLVKHYQKLIESLAYKYSKGQSHHEDLVQVGMVGLIGAINRFDMSFERKFEPFSTYCNR